jgi:hypothetical protein
MNFLTPLILGLEIQIHGSEQAWEKGERLAKLVAYRGSLLILDGL